MPFLSRQNDERGATAVEYGLVAGLIALGLIGALVGTRGSPSSVFTTAAGQMGVSTTPAPVLNLNSALPRASFWSAKTLASPVTVTTTRNSLGIYKEIQAKFTDGSSFDVYYNINGKNYRATTRDPSTNTLYSINADTSGFPGTAVMSFYGTNPDGTSFTSKFYQGDNSGYVYMDDGPEKGYPLNQVTTLYNPNGSVASTSNSAITDDFKTAIQNSEADAYLFKNSGY